MLTSFKRKVILLLFLCIIFAGFVGARYLFLNNQNVYGRLKVVSSPSAAVFVDNTPAGRTPFENKYKVGEYTVKIIPEEGDKQIATWQGKVKIFKNALTYVNRELGSSDNTSAGEILTIEKMSKNPENPSLGEIFVETEPSGAIINLDNDEKGVAPFTLERVLKGDHELSAVLPGFLNRTQKVNITSGYRLNVSFKLALDPSQEKPIASASASPSASLTASPSAKLIPSKTVKPNAKVIVEIQDTPIGFLRVRAEPAITASESAQVKPGEKYDLLEEVTGWYKIKIQTGSGWVSSDYAVKKEE